MLMRHRRRPLTALLVTLALVAGRATAQQTDPPKVEDAIAAAVELLVKTQERYEPDPPVGVLPEDELAGWQKRERSRLKRLQRGKSRAEWPYEGVYRIRPDGRIPPGYRVGGTAIVCLALAHDPEFASHKAAHAAIERAVEFMLDELESNEKLQAGPKRGYDVRGWAHTYALEFFLFAERKGLVEDEDVQARIEKMIPHLLECLAANETPQGGWNYAGPTLSPFMTGSTLLTLFRAREQGHAFDHGLVDRALDGLERARGPAGAYVYAGQLSRRTPPMPGSCARTAIAELCLHLAGRSDELRLQNAVYAFFTHWDRLFERKSQQGTHIAPFGVAPYYFMYAHTYTAIAIEHLPKRERRELRKRMQETLWQTREDDGGWNDRIFPRTKSYSTAMGLLALAAPNMDPLPTWKADAAAPGATTTAPK